jgi:hypothetical protein
MACSWFVTLPLRGLFTSWLTSRPVPLNSTVSLAGVAEGDPVLFSSPVPERFSAAELFRSFTCGKILSFESGLTMIILQM